MSPAGKANRFVAFIDEGLGNSSYLVDCGQGLAVAVDPVRDVAPYLEAAAARHLKIVFTLETHLHADFVSGGRELATQGAQTFVPAGEHAAFEHRAIHADEEIRIGEITIRALATPGHTPGHLAYLVSDETGPIALLSGGALLPGTVARTDLIAADQTEPLARSLYRAVRESFAPLADDLVVYPTHGGGSFCSAAPGAERTTTIGRERLSNPVFFADEDSFVRDLIAGYGSYPPYFLRLRELNRTRAIAVAEKPLRKLPVESARKIIADGAEIIDVRPVREWAAAHVAGSLSIYLRPAFASWLGWLVEMDTPILFVLNQGQDRAELMRQCRKIGYENIVGEIDGGVEAWRGAGFPTGHVAALEAEQAASTVLDVRQDNEFATGHLPRALHVELGDLPGKAEELAGVELSLMCGHGERAATAASVLLRRGNARVKLLLGGPDDWSRHTGRSLEMLG